MCYITLTQLKIMSQMLYHCYLMFIEYTCIEYSFNDYMNYCVLSFFNL